MPIRIGVIGTGRMGQWHARLIADAIPGARLTGIADVDRARAERLARLLGVERWHAQYEDLLARADIDAVVIATPSDTHATVVCDAARAGKPIFCEKPLALTIEETDRAIAVVEAAGVPLQIGFHYHFRPAYIEARAAIHAGEIGMPLLFKALHRDESIPPPSFCDVAVSGGILVDMGIHEFDLACWLFGDEIIEVYAVAPPPAHPGLAEVGDVDRALVSLRLRSGAAGSVEVARNTHYPDESRHDLLGSAGTILLGNPPQTNMFLSSVTHRRGVLAPELSLAMNDGYRLELASFVEYVRDGVLPTVDGHTSRAALRVALAARESLQTGVPVQIAE
ncbi:MAG TPA: Gfo/Idh/MocA family oxidoreductase [Roseiflexaceae bacterium]